MTHLYLRMSMLLLVACFSSYLTAQDFQELFQGFEEDSNDTWIFSPTPSPYDIDEDAWTISGPTSEILPATGGQFWYMRDLDNSNGGFDGFHTLDFENVDVSGFTYNTIAFKYYTIGYEAGDSLGYIIETEAGTGFNMANYTDLSRNTEGWVTVFVNLPLGVNNARLRLMAKQNGGSDFAAFDDVFLTSSDIDLLPPVVTGVELLGGNSIRVFYNEPMDQASVETASNYTIAATISNITYTNPGDGTSYVDITLDSDLIDGQLYTLTVGLVTDLSGNFYLDGEMFDLLYNNSLPALVITEIMYNPSIAQETEFIEIYNASDASIAIGGLTLNAGNNVFPMPATDLPAGSTILISRDEAAAEAFYGLDFYDWGNGALGNGGDIITITNFSGQLVDSVNYSDDLPWPVEADGNGPSLELIAPSLDNNLANSWVASTTQFMDTEVFATPGIISDASTPIVAFEEPVLIIEEGSGLISLPLVVEQIGSLDATATVDVVAASTAVDGEDYVIASTTFDFTAGDNTSQLVELNILDNDALGGRYLILEINEEAGTVGVGENSRFILLIQDNDDEAPVADANAYVQLNHLGSFDLEGDALAEIIAYDGESQRLFVTNSEDNTVEAINYSDPANLSIDFTLFLGLVGNSVNSVAVSNGIVAVAVEGDNPEDNGFVVFFDIDGNDLSIVPVGALPDMLTFTPDGNTVLTANEGEPNDDYTIDPEGSISIIDISGGAENPTVNTIGFADFNSQQANLIAQGVRIFGPGATVAQDLEPEYITVSDDGAFAYVACQENNALAIIDLNAQAVSNILPLGTKDWTADGVSFDASDRTDDIFFANWPIRSFYHPDAIDYFNTGGAGYLITANKGDARDYDGYTEEFRIKDEEIVLDPDAFPDAEYLKEDALLGRLRITAANGDTDGDGDYDELYAYGGRSFSIWNATTGELVYDSGNDLEQITAADPVFGAIFNTTDDENEFKSRSDDKGPEPETVITAEIDGRHFAFIGLERIGGIIVYNVTNPESPVFLQYINTRTVDTEGGDLSPEGLSFIPAEDSPSGKPLLTVAYEVSGTIGVFELDLNCPIVSIPDEISICDGDVALIEVSGVYEDIQWSTGDTVSSIIVEEAGTLTVMTTTEGGCMASDTVEVIVVPQPEVDLGEDVTACEGEPVTLNAGEGFETYLWSNAAETSSIEVLESGTYEVTATDNNGCIATDEVEVTINPLPMVDFPEDTTACVEDILVYDPGEGSVIIVDEQELDQYTTEGLSAGTYQFEGLVVNEAGCELDVTLSFTLEVCSSTTSEAIAGNMEIYPNPTTGWATLRLEQLARGAFTMDITTPAGQLIQRRQLSNLGINHQREIDLRDVPAGIYIIRLYNEWGSQVRRLIVE